MDARGSDTVVPAAANAELNEFLRTSGSTLTSTEAIVRALQHWMTAQREIAAPLRGYQWKCLFLPDQTKLRMHVGVSWHYADVVGDELVYQGHAVSPRQLTIAIAGDGRNAWRDLWVRRPGEKNWTIASVLRRQLEHHAPSPQISPMEAVRAAASSMSDALQAALTLIEHANQQALQKVERRLPRHRRQDDFMIDEYKAD